MSMLLLNGASASLHEQQFALFHGESVFTTLRSYNGALLLWRLHWQRFTRHADFFGYAVPSEGVILERILPHLHDGDKKIRIIAGRTHDAITIEPYTPPPQEIYHGVAVMLSSWHVHNELAHYKTGNSLPYLMAHREAVAAGAFEALLTNHHGFVVDGARTSIVHYDGTTLTALDGGLDGCMRAFAMRVLEKEGIDTTTRLMKPHELTGQVFIMNSLMGVIPVLPIVSPTLVEHVVTLFHMDGMLHPIFHDVEVL